MQKESILYGIIGLLAGILLAILFTASAVNNNMSGMMRMMGIKTQNAEIMEGRQEEMMGHDDENMTMQQMSESLKDKVGDDFDKEFTSLMIEHHQGAIDMANLAKQNAKHQEIKNLADDITSAQTSEIKMMQDWQALWGY